MPTNGRDRSNSRATDKGVAFSGVRTRPAPPSGEDWRRGPYRPSAGAVTGAGTKDAESPKSVTSPSFPKLAQSAWQNQNGYKTSFSALGFAKTGRYERYPGAIYR